MPRWVFKLLMAVLNFIPRINQDPSSREANPSRGSLDESDFNSEESRPFLRATAQGISTADLETGLHGISTSTVAVIEAEDNLKKAMKFSCWITGLSFGGIIAIDSGILQNPEVVTSKLPLKASIILMVLNMFFGVASITLSTFYPPTGRLITITTVIKHITLVSMALATILASIPLLA